MDWKDNLSQNVCYMAIDLDFQLGKLDDAKSRIRHLWCETQHLDLDIPAMHRVIVQGLLKSEVGLSESQVRHFLDELGQRSRGKTMTSPIKRITAADWQRFLDAWSLDVNEALPALDAKEPYRGMQAGASEAELTALETRLGVTLPPSYRAFLKCSNGLHLPSDYITFFGTQDIEWFKTHHQDWIDIWNDGDDEISDDDYFQYGAHQDSVNLRTHYMQTALQISTTEDGWVFLLNPQIVDEQGEWEAWDFGTKLPGADRYRSFWDMMQVVCERELEALSEDD